MKIFTICENDIYSIIQKPFHWNGTFIAINKSTKNCQNEIKLLLQQKKERDNENKKRKKKKEEK